MTKSVPRQLANGQMQRIGRPPKPLKPAATPEAAAQQARLAKKRKEKEKLRLEELRRMRALDRLQLARHEPNGPPKALKELFGGLTRERAVKVIVTIMTKSRDDDMRFAAARYVLERTDGPVPRALELGGRDGQPIQISDERPSLQQMLGLAVQSAIDHSGPDAPKTIEGESAEETELVREAVKTLDEAAE